MKVTNISKKKFDDLEKIELTGRALGTEGEMFILTFPNGKEKVLKRLYSSEGLTFANKLYTLEMLDVYREYIPEYFILPDSLVSIGRRIEAFTCNKVEGENLSNILYNPKISSSEQLRLLKQVGNIIEQMAYIRKNTPLKDFYLNDLHEANFMVSSKTGQVHPIDLDGCKIANNKTFASKYLSPYSLFNETELTKYEINKDTESPGYIVPNEDSELYCYSMCILNYLLGDNINNFKLEKFYEYLYYLETIGINRELLNSFEILVTNSPNVNPSNYLASITQEQVAKAKNKIFKLKTQKK